MLIEVKPVIDTLVGMRGQRWKEVRSILSPTFRSFFNDVTILSNSVIAFSLSHKFFSFCSMNKLKHMSHIVNNAISTLVDIMEEKVVKDEELDVFQMFQGLTCDVIGECALAMKVIFLVLVWRNETFEMIIDALSCYLTPKAMLFLY